MKKVILFFLLCLLSGAVFCQKVIIAVEFQNRLICGIHNFFDIAVENIPNDSLFLKTDNGIIDQEEGFFKTTPIKLGEATISVYKIRALDTLLLTSKKFQVINVGEFAKASFDEITAGNITKKKLIATHHLTANVENLAFLFELRITNYRVIIFRNDSLFFTKQYESEEISKELKEKFRTTQSGDMIYFIDIVALTPVNLNTTLNTIRLTVE